MAYPFIYTRTKFIDYRILELSYLAEIPVDIWTLFSDIAASLVNVKDSQLEEISWAFVRKRNYILWGIASLNKNLGSNNQDIELRPIRGFFGFIAKDLEIDGLPFEMDYFKRLYNTYVTPIWTDRHFYEITEPLILCSSSLQTTFHINNNLLNKDLSVCRIFSGIDNPKALIEASINEKCDCAVAINIPELKQVTKIGSGLFSFNNIVMRPYGSSTDYIDKPFSLNNDKIIYNINKKLTYTEVDKSDITNCESEAICEETETENRYRSKLTYLGIIIFILVSILFLYDGDSFWDKVLPDKKKEITIIDELRNTEQSNKEDESIVDSLTFKTYVWSSSDN